MYPQYTITLRHRLITDSLKAAAIANDKVREREYARCRLHCYADIYARHRPTFSNASVSRLVDAVVAIQRAVVNPIA